MENINHILDDIMNENLADYIAEVDPNDIKKQWLDWFEEKHKEFPNLVEKIFEDSSLTFKVNDNSITFSESETENPTIEIKTKEESQIFNIYDLDEIEVEEYYLWFEEVVNSDLLLEQHNRIVDSWQVVIEEVKKKTNLVEKVMDEEEIVYVISDNSITISKNERGQKIISLNDDLGVKFPPLSLITFENLITSQDREILNEFLKLTLREAKKIHTKSFKFYAQIIIDKKRNNPQMIRSIQVEEHKINYKIGGISIEVNHYDQQIQLIDENGFTQRLFPLSNQESGNSLNLILKKALEIQLRLERSQLKSFNNNALFNKRDNLFKKYRLTDETMRFNGRTLYRIEAVRNFGQIRKGELGGWVESELNLSHRGMSWIAHDSKAYDNARITQNSRLSEKAIAYGSTEIKGKAEVSGESEVFGNSKVGGNFYISGKTIVKDFAELIGDGSLQGESFISNNAKLKGILGTNLYVTGNLEISYPKELNYVNIRNYDDLQKAIENIDKTYN